MGKKRILVVDDEPDFVGMIKLRLEASGYEVLTASDGKEALDILAGTPPDAVLLDILMPGINGLSVLKQVRKKNKDLPVFIITAFSTEDRFAEANKYNASGFIVKTGDLKKEVEHITGILNMADKYRHP